MLDITDDMFNMWPLSVCGTLLGPMFSTGHIIAICGQLPIHSSSTQISSYVGEEELYKWLESIGNEFSCKLFYYIAKNLISLRREALNKISVYPNHYFIRNKLNSLISSTQQFLVEYEWRVTYQSEMRDVENSVSRCRI